MIDLITITGTKGKTTVTRVLADVISTVKNPVLRVDTTGAYLNGKMKVDLKTSLAVAGLVPSVSPGRFLTLLAEEDLKNSVAILEASLGSSNSSGLGYRVHKVGVFTNVFEDHLGSSARLKNKADIAEAKSFIFKRFALDGYAVFNSDDEHVVSKLSIIPKKRGTTKIPCGFGHEAYDINSHLAAGGDWVTVREEEICIVSKSGVIPVLRVDEVSWTFGGQFKPSVYNLMFIVGALYGYFDKQIPKKVIDALKKSRLDDNGGRLTLFENDNGVKILADYAHEKFSLVEVAKLAHNLSAEKGKVIGVLRLAYDRTDELIKDTATHIAPYYDRFIIYDKIDGHWKQPTLTDKRIKFTQEVGKISKIFYDSLIEHGADAERIIREDEALALAAKMAEPGDVVVEIVNDDIDRSLQFIRDTFTAERVG